MFDVTSITLYQVDTNSIVFRPSPGRMCFSSTAVYVTHIFCRRQLRWKVRAKAYSTAA